MWRILRLWINYESSVACFIFYLFYWYIAQVDVPMSRFRMIEVCAFLLKVKFNPTPRSYYCPAQYVRSGSPPVPGQENPQEQAKQQSCSTAPIFFCTFRKMNVLSASRIMVSHQGSNLLKSRLGAGRVIKATIATYHDRIEVRELFLWSPLLTWTEREFIRFPECL